MPYLTSCLEGLVSRCSSLQPYMHDIICASCLALSLVWHVVVWSASAMRSLTSMHFPTGLA